MPIQVTCPSCLSRFSVSDKFAGQKGPCPKCKKPITIPAKSEEVVIHAPRDDTPKDSKGRSVLKPIKRTETRVTRKGILFTVAVVAALLILAIVFRVIGGLSPWLTATIGALLIAPPTILAAYAFSRDSELAPFVGDELRNRVLVLTPLFSLLWLVYAFVPVYIMDLDQPSHMPLFMSGLMIAVVLTIGSFAAANAMDLEFSGGLVVAGLYVVSALILALIAGIPLASFEPPPKRNERELILDPEPAAMFWQTSPTDDTSQARAWPATFDEATL